LNNSKIMSGVDKSKRVAPGGNIDPKNIISGTRTRTRYDYKTMTVLEGKEEKKTTKKVVNKPTKASKKSSENVEDVVEKMSNLNIEKEAKVETKPEVVVVAEPVKVEEKVEDKVEDKKVKQETKTRKKVQNAKELPKELSTEVLKLIEKSGGKYEKQETRMYKDLIEIPFSILQFLDHKFEGEFENETLEVSGIIFEGEFALEEEEANEFKFLKENKDAMLIGDGEKLIACLLSDKKQDLTDFNLYILEDENPEKVAGPYKLSQFLKDAKVTPRE
jgi:hypothetical protein